MDGNANQLSPVSKNKKDQVMSFISLYMLLNNLSSKPESGKNPEICFQMHSIFYLQYTFSNLIRLSLLDQINKMSRLIGAN